MRNYLLALALLTACTRSERTDPLDRTGSRLVVHEWGTYTSLQGSDGRSMDGLHHAEHLLPAFVFARDHGNPDQKGIGSLPEPVNQKLETPVLYFYGDRLPSVTVKVGFPEGIISEWYPDATTFSPPREDMPRMANGTMTWKIDLVDPNGGNFSPVEVPADSIWAPSRRVNALGVKYVDPNHPDLPEGYQDERFIFYRGLGRFERPFRVVSGGDRIACNNDGTDRIAAAFLLKVTEAGGAILELGAIDGHGQASGAIPNTIEPTASYLAHAKSLLMKALVETGLYEDEARAMVDTWEHSYFASPGTRVLYLAPRTWTDALLPIQIDPAPTELVRTLVGRVEVLTTAEEQEVVDLLRAAKVGEATIAPDTYGRFTEPKIRRASELIDDPALKDWVQAVADSFASQP